MTTYYVKTGGNDSADGLSDATAWLTPSHAEVILRGSTSSHKILCRCGDTFSVYSLRMSVGGTSTSSLAEWGSYYLSGGVETEGVSGIKPIFADDYGPNMLAGDSFASGIYYPPPKNAQNGRWYLALGSGTFPSTFPALSTTIGATQVINGVSFTVVQCGSVNSKYNTGIINRSSSDSANFIRYKNLIIKNARGMGWRNENEANLSAPTLNYFELIDIDFENCAATAYQTANNTSMNVGWLINGITVHNCGKTARDGNFSSTYGRPAFIRHRGRANTTVTRTLKNFIFTGNWQEGLISSPQNLVQDGINHAAYVHFYFIGNTDVSNVVRDNIIERVVCVGTTDAYYNRVTGYDGVAFWFANESAGGADIMYNTIRNCCTAFTAGFLHIGNRNTAPGSVFDYTKIIFCTSVDDRFPFEATSTTGHTGAIIKNNAFIQKTSGLTGYTGGSLGGIECDYNYWSTQAMAGNAAGAHDIYGDIDGISDIYKQTGWQNILAYTEINVADFRPSADSTLFGSGVAISGVTTDINGDTRSDPPTIGAWETAYDAPGGGGGGEATIPSIYTADTKFAYGNTGTGLTIARPTNLANGNMVLLEFETTNSASAGVTNLTNVTGFAQAVRSQEASSANRPEAAVWWKIIDDIDSEPATYSFDCANPWIAHAYRIDGQHPTVPIGQTSVANSSGTNVATITLTGFTTPGDNSLLFACIAERDGSATAQSCSGMTELHETDKSGSTSAAAAYYELRDTAGATGDRTINWTNSTRVAALMFEILPGTVAADITPPVNTVPAYVSSKTDTSFTLTFTLTDDTTTNIHADAVATRTCFPRPSASQTFAHDDGNDLDATDFDAKTNIASGVSNTLTLNSGLTEPKYNWAFIAKDNASSPNSQLFPVAGTVLLDPPSGFEYAEVTIDSGASTDSVLSGLVYSIGDVIVYPSATTEDALPIDIDGAGLITITRGGNTNTQTFSAYLWSQLTGNTQAITFQDPFYQSQIGEFGNNTNTKLVSTTIYVVAALDADEDGNYLLPAHKPLNILESLSLGVAVAVDLDSDGFGTYYNTIPGKYYGKVYNADGSYIGELGYDGTIGITVA